MDKNGRTLKKSPALTFTLRRRAIALCLAPPGAWQGPLLRRPGRGLGLIYFQGAGRTAARRIASGCLGWDNGKQAKGAKPKETKSKRALKKCEGQQSPKEGRRVAEPQREARNSRAHREDRRQKEKETNKKKTRDKKGHGQKKTGKGRRGAEK